MKRQDKNGEVMLEERRIGEVSIDGTDAFVDDEGETRTLPEFSYQLNFDNKVLRDGSNCFGGVPYPEELRGVEAGDTIEFISHNPLFSMMNHQCEYLGSNEDELRAKYGLAWVPFAKDLLRFRVRYNGKESEATWGHLTEIKVHKRSDS